MTDTGSLRPPAASRPRMLVAGLTLVGASVLLGAWILVTGYGAFAVDAWWNAVVQGAATGSLLAVGLGMDWLGAGWFAVLAVPIGVAVALVVGRRPRAAAYFLVAEAVSAGAVQLMKQVIERPRPDDILVFADIGSYPSGHVANAATIAVALAVLFPRRWVVVLGGVWVVLMAGARTLVHAHWFTDTLGGAMLGTGVALVVGAVMWSALRRDRPRSAVSASEPRAGAPPAGAALPALPLSPNGPR